MLRNCKITKNRMFEALALDEKAADTKHDMGGDIAPYFEIGRAHV